MSDTTAQTGMVISSGGRMILFVAGIAFTILVELAIVFGWAMWEARGLGELPPQPFDRS